MIWYFQKEKKKNVKNENLLKAGLYKLYTE